MDRQNGDIISLTFLSKNSRLKCSMNHCTIIAFRFCDSWGYFCICLMRHCIKTCEQSHVFMSTRDEGEWYTWFCSLSVPAKYLSVPAVLGSAHVSEVKSHPLPGIEPRSPIAYSHCTETVAWRRRLVSGLSPCRFGFAPGSVHVEFMVNKVELGHVFLRVLWVSLSVSFHDDSPCSYHLRDEQ
jgi:hypothetical protein